MAAKESLQWFTHRRVAMHGQKQRGVGITLEHLQHSCRDVVETLAPVLTPMHGGEDHPLSAPVEAIKLNIGR